MSVTVKRRSIVFVNTLIFALFGNLPSLTLLLFGVLLIATSSGDDMTLNEPNVDRHAIFSQPITKGIFSFDEKGFIPLDPMVRIGKVHKEIIKTIQGINDYKKQAKYLLTLSNTANEDIEKLREKINDAIPRSENGEEVYEFDKRKLKADAFVLLVSHAGMISNLILYFPDTMGLLLKKNPTFETNLKWTVRFTVNSRLTQEKSHVQLFHLAQQELGIIPKDPDYKNPYRTPSLEEMAAIPRTTTKKPRKKLPRGPQMSGGGRGEL